jgi:hypothetical protein
VIPLLAWLHHRAAVLALGYLVAGWRGLLAALVAREALTLIGAALRGWWAEAPPPVVPRQQHKADREPVVRQ